MIPEIIRLRSNNDFLASKIARFLTSSGRKVTVDTVADYLRLLEDAYIFLRAGRYDIKGKNLMKTNHTCYLVDLGLRHILVGTSAQDYGASLENIIYLELIRRGYQVTTGKYRDLEIKIIARPPKGRLHIQVSAGIMDEHTRERELRSLRAVQDEHPKLVLTMDKLPYHDFEGI